MGRLSMLAYPIFLVLPATCSCYIASLSAPEYPLQSSTLSFSSLLSHRGAWDLRGHISPMPEGSSTLPNLSL